MFDPRNISEPAFRYYDRLARVKRYVDEHYCEPISVTDGARIAGLEVKYYSKFFHEKVGVCFREWLNHVRVTKATELMKAHNHTITEIAFAVGFQDLRTFERSFKKTMAETPRSFKRSVRPS
jgi:two-component system response regulator YesN